MARALVADDDPDVRDVLEARLHLTKPVARAEIVATVDQLVAVLADPPDQPTGACPPSGTRVGLETPVTGEPLHRPHRSPTAHGREIPLPAMRARHLTRRVRGGPRYATRARRRRLVWPGSRVE